MAFSKKLLTLFWHIPCLGFFTALIAFLFGQGIYILSAGKSIGSGLINISKFLLNPNIGILTYQSESPFNSEPEWIAHGNILKVACLPLILIITVLLFIQSLVLIISVFGFQLGITIYKSIKPVFKPEHVKFINTKNN